jgi:hypothetical protein
MTVSKAALSSNWPSSDTLCVTETAVLVLLVLLTALSLLLILPPAAVEEAYSSRYTRVGNVSGLCDEDACIVKHYCVEHHSALWHAIFNALPLYVTCKCDYRT